MGQTLTDEDRELAEHACRALANRYRIDAERQNNPAVREASLASAAKLDRLALRMCRLGRRLTELG